MSNRQIALIKLLDDGPDAEGGESSGSVLDSIPLGTHKQVCESLAHFNTATDNAPESIGVLYGPGFTVQLPFVGPNDPVMQILISLEDEDCAWPVLTRICKRLRWKMLDPNSGRTFG